MTISADERARGVADALIGAYGDMFDAQRGMFFEKDAQVWIAQEIQEACAAMSANTIDLAAYAALEAERDALAARLAVLEQAIRLALPAVDCWADPSLNEAAETLRAALEKAD